MRHPKRYQVLLKGEFNQGNFGDDLLLHVAYNWLTTACRPEEIGILAPPESYLKEIIKTPNFVAREQQHQVSANLLVYTGGTRFYSFPLTCRPSIGERCLQCVLRNSKNPRPGVAALYRMLRFGRVKPGTMNIDRTAAIGVGFGPFCSKSSEREAVREMRSLEYLAVRDSVSYDFCRAWGLNQARCFADMCFSLEPWVKPPVPQPCAQHPVRLGFIIRDWPHTITGSTYYDSVIAAEQHFRAAGADTAFILFGEDPYWSSRLPKLGASVVRWEPRRHFFQNFLSELSTFDIFVTARFHGAVIAGLLHKPVVCIEVEPKLEIIASQLGEGACVWRHPFAVRDCISAIETHIAQYASCSRALANQVAGLRSAANMMKESFLEYLTTARICPGAVE